MKKIIIFGEAMLAELAKFYFENDSDYSVCGFVVDEEYLNDGRDSFLGLPLALSTTITECFSPSEYDAFVAIGYSNMNQNRERKIEWLRGKGYHLASYVSSSAVLWDKKQIGENCMVMENVVLQPFTRIDDGCILSAGVNIAHGSRLRKNVFLGSNATLAGCVNVGRNSFIGINACVKNNVSIADFSLVGAGAYISKDTVPYGIYGTNGTVDSMRNKSEEERMDVQRLLL